MSSRITKYPVPLANCFVNKYDYSNNSSNYYVFNMHKRLIII